MSAVQEQLRYLAASKTARWRRGMHVPLEIVG